MNESRILVRQVMRLPRPEPWYGTGAMYGTVTGHRDRIGTGDGITDGCGIGNTVETSVRKNERLAEGMTDVTEMRKPSS